MTDTERKTRSYGVLECMGEPVAEGEGNGLRPILAIHGFQGSAGQFSPMFGLFEGAGYSAGQLYTYAYDTGWEAGYPTLTEQSQDLAQKIHKAFGSTEFDIVAHSMGGLIARAAIKWGDENSGIAPLRDQVVNCVSLAGPNHGASNGWLETFGSIMWAGELQDMAPDSDFLDSLNKDTEAPGPTKWLTYYSPGDEEVNEYSVPLQGADNRQIDLRGTVAPSNDDPIHNGYLTSKEVTAAVIDFLSPVRPTPVDPTGVDKFLLNWMDRQTLQIGQLWMARPEPDEKAVVDQQPAVDFGEWTYKWYATDIEADVTIDAGDAGEITGTSFRIKGYNGYHSNGYFGMNLGAGTPGFEFLCTTNTGLVHPEWSYFLLVNPPGGGHGWHLGMYSKDPSNGGASRLVGFFERQVPPDFATLNSLEFADRVEFYYPH